MDGFLIGGLIAAVVLCLIALVAWLVTRSNDSGHDPSAASQMYEQNVFYPEGMYPQSSQTQSPQTPLSQPQQPRPVQQRPVQPQPVQPQVLQPQQPQVLKPQPVQPQFSQSQPVLHEADPSFAAWDTNAQNPSSGTIALHDNAAFHASAFGTSEVIGRSEATGSSEVTGTPEATGAPEVGIGVNDTARNGVLMNGDATRAHASASGAQASVHVCDAMVSTAAAPSPSDPMPFDQTLSAQMPSDQPSSSQPVSAQPLSAQPAPVQPAPAQPTSAQPIPADAQLQAWIPDEILRNAETQWAEENDWAVEPDSSQTIKPEPVIVYDSAKMPVNGASRSQTKSEREVRETSKTRKPTGEPAILKPRYYGSAPPDLKYHTTHGVAPRVTRNDLRETVSNPDIRYAFRDKAALSDRFASGKIGEQGEAKTRRIVDEWAKQHHAVVRHGYFVNKQIKDSDVDHVIAFESDGVQHVLLLDSKNYAPGIYDRDRRKLDRADTWEPFVQSNSMELASKQLQVTLLGMPFRSQVQCYTVVWCSSKNGKVVLRGYEKSGTFPINGEMLPQLLEGFPDASEPNVGVVRALDWAFSPRGKVKKTWSLGMERQQHAQQRAARKAGNGASGASAGADARAGSRKRGNAGKAQNAMSEPGNIAHAFGTSETTGSKASHDVAGADADRRQGAQRPQRSGRVQGPKRSQASRKPQRSHGSQRRDASSAAEQVFGTFNEGMGMGPQFADGSVAADTGKLDAQELKRRTREFEKHTQRALDRAQQDSSSSSVGFSSAGASSVASSSAGSSSVVSSPDKA